MSDRPAYLDALLRKHLHDFLGDLEPAAMARLTEQLTWLELPGGQPLMTQGEVGDAMFVLVSGRMRVSITSEDGVERAVREITRGQVVGEMSLLTDDPRSATVVAVRDSVLVRLGKPEFNRLLATSAAVSIALTRQIVRRLQTPGQRNGIDRPVAIGLLPVSDGITAADLADFAEQLAVGLRQVGPVAVLDAARLEALAGMPGLTTRPASDTDATRDIAVCLDEVESAHAFVLLLADATPTPWTQRCSRHCDELLLLAHADAPPVLHATERDCLVQRPARTHTPEVLVLLHPPQQASPAGTVHWLQRRPVTAHVHLRIGNAPDMARMARLISRTAVGLVLSGGGARGAAHAGVYKALVERGVPVDVAGGTSMGAVFAALIALDATPEKVIDMFRAHYAANPTGDFALLPMLSLVKGVRLRDMMQRTECALAGRNGLGLEDTWKSYYCVATNYSHAREEVLRQGGLVDAVMASSAVPGALPPVLRDGDLLCDGGTFNNFPVDVMRRQWGVGKVIGVDLSFEAPQRIELDTLPGPWALLRDRLRPRRLRRYRLPSLMTYLMSVTSLVSVSRQRESGQLADVYIKPALARVGMLQWGRYESTVQQGYEEALRVLDGVECTPD
ncbi:patatin-like phospholipase family protein [Hydrogenophaga sp.]|uniref:patatin-like phospholipase family protein n=1 Tax=Hydrogenophaga sp. TaxID=1904254 RepID=UPI002718BD16|nr:cyclic nucleotide-binding and patatin-like phospholipase domain-containing protein [Hydrogenophaga sp.]MDO9434181.1 cyclic nucleotide-binding and patatin-like phospholipase domain-containing protein [Hydrogenophaga sp.]